MQPESLPVAVRLGRMNPLGKEGLLFCGCNHRLSITNSIWNDKPRTMDTTESKD